MSPTGDSGAIDRRTFLIGGTLGAAGMVAGLSPAHAGEAPVEEGVVYRTLGRTGLKVSVVSMGAFLTTEPAVMQAAFDRGVNYIDTAREYMNGNNEGYVATALKGYRDRVYVATKLKLGPKEDMLRSVDDSLARLQVDYVDVMQLHRAASRDDALNEDVKDVLTQAKKNGKARFIGVTTHKNEIQVLDAVLEDPDKVYDTVLVTYNFKSSQETADAIACVAKAGVGVIAMKTQAGGYETEEMGEASPHQAALKWVLRDRNVAAAVPSMVDLAQVKEDTAVMGMLEMTREEARVLERYGDAIAPFYCRLCGGCEGSCPNGVDVHQVNRSLMYADGYRDMALARATYAELPVSRSASACDHCRECVARCVHGLDIAAKMRRARVLLC